MSFDKLDSSLVYECGISNRINARSISWNSSGTALAMAGSDRTTKLYSMMDLMSSSSSNSGASSSNNNASSIRELTTIAGAVDRARFHPTQDSLLATTSGSDAVVKLWDLRSSTSAKAAGKIELTGSSGNGMSTVDISWSPSKTSTLLVVTEKNGNVHVVDTRKLGSSSSVKTPGGTNSNPSNSNSSPFRKTFALRPKIVDACVFSPSGDHLVAATSEEGYGELTAWNWEASDEGGSDATAKEEKSDDNRIQTQPLQQKQKQYVYPAHTGPIYSFCFSPNGRKLATGGGDALVGLWDVDTMVCSSTITRYNRFVRSVSFSYDSKIIATSTEENSIDLANSETGTFVGKVSMTDNNSNNKNSSNNRLGANDRNAPGADEIAFHPKTHLLACARCDSGSHSPLTVMKLSLGRQ